MASLDQLLAAYEAGRTAGPKDKNPYFFGSPLNIEWDYGRRDGALLQVQHPTNRIKLVARLVFIAAAITMVFGIGRYALL